jgi:hypothetical protein
MIGIVFDYQRSLVIAARPEQAKRYALQLLVA